MPKLNIVGNKSETSGICPDSDMVYRLYAWM